MLAGGNGASVSLDLYAVMGNPIDHSKSPWIHSMFAGQTAQAISYTRILVEIDGFAEAITAFWEESGRGANVTVPFKEDAWRWVGRRSERAERAGAVNTVVLPENGHSVGDNTDGVGLVRDLSLNHGVSLEGLRVLLLGAGGAARGVLAPIMGENPASLVVANRTVARGNDLAREFAVVGDIEASGFADLAGSQFDLIINATAAGLSGQVPPLPPRILAPGGCCYDMVYGDRPTAFVEWGRGQGAVKCLDGLGMLVEQAAESFFVWRGVRPDTQPVIAALRAGMPPT